MSRNAVARLTLGASYGRGPVGATGLWAMGYGLAIGYWPLAIGYWLLAIGDWRLATRDWRLATRDTRPTLLPGSTMRSLFLLLLLVGCQSSGDTRERTSGREHDSVVGASKLPGSAGVRGALR